MKINTSTIFEKAEKNNGAITLIDNKGNAWRLKKINPDIIKKIGEK